MKNGDLPAMPVLYWSSPEVGQVKTCAEGGLTKREMFAMAAMQAVIGSKIELSEAHVSAMACTYADALLAELERGS
jgi:hypothetical protein